MYSIQFSDWGLVFEFTGPVYRSVIQDWLGDIEQLMGGFSEPFSVVVDLKGADPEASDIQDTLQKGLRMLKDAGMERAAVVIGASHREAWSGLPSESDIPGLRYVVARKESEWASRTQGWVQRGDEPDGDSQPRTAHDGST